MSDTPKTTAADAYETMEALLCEMQGLRDELVEVKRERDEAREENLEQARLLGMSGERESQLITERDEWKAKFIQANKDYGFELMDPCGTIWDHAKKLQQEHDNLQDQMDLAIRMSKKREYERDEARNTARWLYQHGMATLIEGASGNEWIKEEIK